MTLDPIDYRVTFEVKRGDQTTRFLLASYANHNIPSAQLALLWSDLLLRARGHFKARCPLGGELLWVDRYKDMQHLGRWKTFEEAEAALDG